MNGEKDISRLSVANSPASTGVGKYWPRGLSAPTDVSMESLDLAAQGAGYESWAHVSTTARNSTTLSIVSHAKTLDQYREYRETIERVLKGGL
jgi:hypothetical protein